VQPGHYAAFVKDIALAAISWTGNNGVAVVAVLVVVAGFEFLETDRAAAGFLGNNVVAGIVLVLDVAGITIRVIDIDIDILIVVVVVAVIVIVTVCCDSVFLQSNAFEVALSQGSFDVPLICKELSISAVVKPLVAATAAKQSFESSAAVAVVTADGVDVIVIASFVISIEDFIEIVVVACCPATSSTEQEVSNRTLRHGIQATDRIEDRTEYHEHGQYHKVHWNVDKDNQEHRPHHKVGRYDGEQPKNETTVAFEQNFG